MRKLIFLSYLFLSVQVIVAQRSSLFISDHRLFVEGKAMYDDKNYAGCIDKLREYLKTAKDVDLIQESEFYLLASSFRQGHESVTSKLIDFLYDYPETRHSDEVCFMTGSCYFSKSDYETAILWLNKADMDNLSEGNQEDYAYRMAYSCFKTGRDDNALRLFGLLKDNSARYKNAATYYLAYLYYREGDLNSALPLFESLKGDPEYQSEVAYYLVQIHFSGKRYAQTIKEGRELLRTYPDHRNNTEINRLTGASYFYENDYENAVLYLTRYVEQTTDPLRGDLYILGLSEYQLKDYSKAIHYLSKSIRENDAITQNAYLYIGQSYLKTGDNQNASRAFEAASRMNFDPQIKEAAMYNYAVLLHQTSSSPFGESVTVLENFLNEYPSSRYADKINDCLVEVYLTTKNYATALNSIDKIKNPGVKILEARQKIYYHQGTVYFINADFKGAADYFTKAVNAGDYAPAEKEKSIYWRGETYYRMGEHTQAIQDYKSFIQNERQSGELVPQADYGLGYSYFNRKQYGTALTYFSDYIRKETDRTKVTLADAYARTGDCYFYERRFSDAEKAYSTSSSLQPSMADYAIYQKGFIMGLQKDYKGKIVQMDRLISSYPDSRYVPDALYEKGRSYVMMDELTPAIQVFQNMFENYPQHALTRKAGVQIGLLYFNRDELQKSVEAYKQVIDRYPGSEEARVAVQDLKSVYVEMNDVSGYAQYVNSLGGEAKFEVSEQDSLTYIAAERFFMHGDVMHAQDAMKKYLQNFPEGAFDINAHYYLGRIYYNQGQEIPAKAEFEKVLEAGDNEFTEDALIRLSEIQFKERNYESALLSYQRLQSVAEGKENKDIALLGIMRSAARLNKNMDVLNAAGALLKESKPEPEKQTEATYYRAKAYLSLNEPAKALPDLTILSKDTRTVYGAEAKYLLAQYYFDHKETKKAEDEIMDYIKQGTPHSYWLARSFILLSDVYISQQDYLQARQYLESLQHNYTVPDDDIHTLINERMDAIKLKK